MSLRPADRNDYITKQTAVAPDGDMPIPEWTTYLDRVTGSDKELQAYLQRVAGYCLTGSIEEHAMFFLYGSGSNGKTIFIITLAGILGDYAKTAPISTFMASKSEQHPTDLAGLQGARLVVANETDKGRRWDEAKIKMITGGDAVSARFMRQDFFTFTPQFKLLISGNHKPRLSSVDDAMRRRFHLVPFTVTIPEKERDTKLGEKLKAEWAGIFHWMIEGCREWQRIGLKPPAKVIAATANYFEEQDTIGRWMEDCCVDDPNEQCARTALFKSWERWAKANNEFVGRPAVFYDELEKQGFEPAKVDGERRYKGLNLTEVEVKRVAAAAFRSDP
ncbi:phage/plasmid primase, P4 family [Reyranella soli]|uniref:SF3 helicase domain-containing protein n=1 Tax=Reyranella soli TaxID=1230389 RepID=A0A512NKI8_9HYPH|nr:phage/plasmid primase, P4 family [Reyranella soli]GEP59464.1 hypothetical protein RSO01_66300 [Reyranella soli]